MIAIQTCWEDRRLGHQQQDVAAEVGDFVLRRADGLWAYQLAVVVDDADQGITDVVRGEDLADNTPRQILLQRALGLTTPRYLHTPLVLGANGEKLSKQNGAQPLDLHDPLAALKAAATALGLPASYELLEDDAEAMAAVWRRFHAAVVREPELPAAGPRESLGQAVRTFGTLFALPHTAGIVALALVTYASFVALRGLWLGPMLMQRHGYSLVQSGNVAVLMTVIALVGPPLFGRLDPGPARRRRWIVGFSTVLALLFGLLAWSPLAWLSVLASLVIGFGCGFIILQYADVRASYPPELTGRALAVYTMAMFLGIALMQWVTGAVAAWAQLHQVETFVAVNSTIMAMLLLGAAAFKGLPAARAVR